MFLWMSLEMFVMVTWEVRSGIRLPRFLIIAFSSTYCTWHNFSFLWFIRTRWIMLIVKRYWCLPWILQRIRFWFQLGLSVISPIGCEEVFNLRFVIERKFQHLVFFNNHAVFHGWTFQKTWVDGENSCRIFKLWLYFTQPHAKFNWEQIGGNWQAFLELK